MASMPCRLASFFFYSDTNVNFYFEVLGNGVLCS